MGRSSWIAVLVLGLWLLTPLAWAQQGAEPAGADANDHVVDLDALTVHGEQPGPGMWRVRHGDYVLWILGTVSPLPKRVQWRPDDVQRVIAESQAVLGSPRFEFHSDIGFFRKLSLLPAMLRLSKNQDGERLQDVLPAALYARWSMLKARYIGRDRGIEKKRPMIAAGKLYEAAVRASGLRGHVVAPVIKRAARDAGIKVTSTSLTIEVEDPKAAINALAAADIDERDCFASLLDAVEHDLPTMVERANAWAVGDIAALRRMPREQVFATCSGMLTGARFAQEHGMDHLDARIAEHWVEVASASLEARRSTFAVVPMSLLLGDPRYLDALRARGYQVEPPPE